MTDITVTYRDGEDQPEIEFVTPYDEIAVRRKRSTFRKSVVVTRDGDCTVVELSGLEGADLHREIPIDQSITAWMADKR